MKHLTTNINAVDTIVEQIVQAVDDGTVNALEAFVGLKKMEEVSTTAKELIYDQAMDEARKEAKSGTVPFGRYGKTIQMSNAAGTYKYNSAAVATTKERLKILQDMEKSVRKGKGSVSIVDKETGEEMPAVSYIPGKEILKLTN